MKTQMFEDERYYVCHDGRELHHIRTETKKPGWIYTDFLRCTDVLTAAAVNIKRNVFINIMQKR